MASWMIHLRIADHLLTRIPNLHEEAFIMGNIAPDSGVPNEDWSKFSPSTAVSHFRTDNGSGKKNIDINAFTDLHFTPDQQNSYDVRAYSFYLGYLTHLLTDKEWSDRIAHPVFEKHNAHANPTMTGLIKGDWYDLDYLYLRDHPDFKAFQIYRNIQTFPNVYMDIFSADAFDNRRAYITRFYLQENEHLDREYPYLTKADADQFVNDACENILRNLEQYTQRMVLI